MGLRQVWDNLSSSLWFRPALWVTSLGLLSLVLTTIDIYLDPLGEVEGLPWFLSGDVQNIRVMLGSIITAILTVASLTFSITMVVVVQASNAYSPHTLREFIADRANQNVLGILTGTFLYGLLVLRAVRQTDVVEYVPLLAVNVAVLLTLVSTGAFVFFIHHVAQSIKVTHFVNRFLERGQAIVERRFPETFGELWTAAQPVEPPPDEVHNVLARSAGYIQTFDPRALLERTYERPVTIRLDFYIGDYVMVGARLATVWPADAGEQLEDDVRAAVVLGPERSLLQDSRYAVRLISDIALRALSPSLNDPSTAVICIDALASLLGHWLRDEPVSFCRGNGGEHLCIVAPAPLFSDLLDEAYGQIVRYGAGDVVVMTHLAETCAKIGRQAFRPVDRAALQDLLAYMAAAIAEAELLPADRRRIAEKLQAVRSSLLDESPAGEMAA